MKEPIAVTVNIEKDLTDAMGINTKTHYSIFIKEATGVDIDKILLMIDRNNYLISKIVDSENREYYVDSNLELQLTEEFQDLPL